MIAEALLPLLDPSVAPSAPTLGPTLPGLPGVPVAPSGTPAWLTTVGYVVALLALLGVGGVLAKFAEGWLGRRKVAAEAEHTQVQADEVFTRVAVTLVEPLRDRLARTEERLAAVIEEHERERAEWRARADRERVAFEGQVELLRGKVREALAEADGAVGEAHRLRRLVQQWHRAIMDPAATIDWLRQLVGPDEPAL